MFGEYTNTNQATLYYKIYSQFEIQDTENLNGDQVGVLGLKHPHRDKEKLYKLKEFVDKNVVF